MRNVKIKQIKMEEKEKFEESIFFLKRIFLSSLKFVNPGGFLKKALMFTIIFLSLSLTDSGTGSSLDSSTTITPKNSEEIYIEIVKGKIKDQLINEVDIYIQHHAFNSKLTPSHIVDKCLEYNIDIIFVMAQAYIESCFGTKGLATKTNSVWNVGAYDNQRPKNWYDSADESLEPYLKLINEQYLINVTSKGDTIYKDLHHLVLKGYTNYAGKRFATALGYENAMRRFMIQIDMETSISIYQDIMNLPDKLILEYFKPNIEDIEQETFYALN